MKHILHLITGLHVGGAEMMLYKLLATMNRKEFSQAVISLTEGGEVADKIRDLEIPVHSLKLSPSKPSPQALLRLIREIKAQKPDLLQTWMYHANFLGSLIRPTMPQTPVIWNIRCSDLSPDLLKASTRGINTLCALSSRWIPHTIVMNAKASVKSHPGYDANKIKIIPNGFDLKQFTSSTEAKTSVYQELQLPPETPLVGMISRFDPYKDHHNFVKAAALLLNEHPQVHFLLCGKGIDAENTELMQWIKSTRQEAQFHLLGPRDDIPRLTAALDLATLSSRGEGFPNVIGEAMACEVPCVVTDVGDAAELVSTTGRVVTPQDPQALADAWKFILLLPQEERYSLGQQARQRIQSHFSLQTITRQYEQLYLNAIDVS